MRTSIVIDDELMEKALRATGLPTKRAVVEEGLKLLIRTKSQAVIRGLKGKVRWRGNRARSRKGRTT